MTETPAERASIATNGAYRALAEVPHVPALYTWALLARLPSLGILALALLASYCLLCLAFTGLEPR